MKEQLVEFETAKLAKEKGFNIPCYNHFTRKGKFRFCHPDDVKYSFVHENEGWVEAPTQSLLQKWLREEHNIFVSINTVSEEKWYSAEDVEHIPVHKYRVIKNIDNFKYDVIDWSEPFETYEEALEKGLQEALKLI